MWLKFLSLLIGILAIALSFYFEKKMDDRRKEKKDSKDDLDNDGLKVDEFDFEEFREKLLSNKEKTQEVYDKESIQDDVNRMVTKKMVEFNEFSEHLLEKIVKNHKEVMFLYDMLTKKEKEIKDLMEKDYSEKMVTSHDTRENDYERNDYEKNDVLKNQAYKINEEINDMIFEEKNEINEEFENSIIEDSNIINEELVLEEKEDDLSAKLKNDDGANVLSDMYAEIVNMKKQGMNNIDISKELQLGTGEVNLILNLYKGKIV